jgi:4-amino-4-deoxy-L-arabinose transferase-like glycosyltransferase
VCAVAAGLVAGAFNPAPHTGGDNAAYLTLAYSLLQDGRYTELFDPAGLPHTKYPPVFPALLALLMALGFRTWVAFKSVAAVATVAAAAFTYLWAERRLGPSWAAGVALLLAGSSAVVYYSHWILSDPLFLALTMMSLWALDRGDEEGAPPGWLVLGVVGAALAYFTRSAGLPLVVAVLAWLAIRRRWRPLAAAAAGMGLPMALWMLRARGAGQGEYVSEFWLVDPYDPSLGRVGLGGLVGRVGDNLVGYVGTHLPAGMVGSQGAVVTLLGVVLVLGALAGWALRLRARPGPAEIFLPLYAGLILLWPVVWSGDRFVLPLYPLLFLYAAGALHRALRARARVMLTAAGAGAFCVVFLPSLGSWTRAAADASQCGALVRRSGPFACYGPGVEAFVQAAGWAGANLPEGASVLTRKPRLFYVLSGVPSRTFPFSDDPAEHLRLADAVGSRYEMFDQWDGLAGRYVAGAVQRQPEAFCAIGGFGVDGATQILGIVPAERGGGGGTGPADVRIAACPPSYTTATPGQAYAPSSSRVPFLDRLRP